MENSGTERNATDARLQDFLCERWRNEECVINPVELCEPGWRSPSGFLKSKWLYLSIKDAATHAGTFINHVQILKILFRLWIPGVSANSNGEPRSIVNRVVDDPLAGCGFCDHDMNAVMILSIKTFDCAIANTCCKITILIKPHRKDCFRTLS